MNIAGGEKFGAHRTVCLSPQVHLNHLGDLGDFGVLAVHRLFSG